MVGMGAASRRRGRTTDFMFVQIPGQSRIPKRGSKCTLNLVRIYRCVTRSLSTVAGWAGTLPRTNTLWRAKLVSARERSEEDRMVG